MFPIEPANNVTIDENNISFNEDENSKEKEQSNEINSPEIAEENNIKNDKGNIIFLTLLIANDLY